MKKEFNKKEYQKLCAKFLGWNIKCNKLISVPNNSNIRPLIYWPAYENFKFDSDWNWIMEVVNKMEVLGSYTIIDTVIKGDFVIGRYGIKFYFNPAQNYLLHLELRPYLLDNVWKHPSYKDHIIQAFDFKNKGKKEAVIQAIWEFLCWYEENNKI